MKSQAFVIVVLIVAILILVNAIASLITPIVRHYWQQYQHYRFLQERRREFYSGLSALMRDGTIT